jgi:hypothetical protein
MRSLLAVVALLAVPQLAAAEAPAPLARWTPPEGRFFDDAFAVSADGKQVAAVSTDAATSSTLHLFPVGGTALEVGGLPPTVRAIYFLTPERVLVIVKQGDTDRVLGLLASVHSQDGKPALTLDKNRLGPANSIDVAEREGKRVVAVYNCGGKKTVDHMVQLLAADGLKPIGKRTLIESAEGAMRTKAGEVRPLWWSRGHTNLSVQKIGEYDRARDVRRPDRFVRLDLYTDKIAEEHEIEDVLGFAKVTIARKSGPPEAAFARLSDDHKEVLLLDGIDERPLPLARPIHLYDPESLRSLILDEASLLVGLQVDANNIAAVGRRQQDPDDFDLYVVDRASMHGKQPLVSRRALVLPGGGRRVGFAAAPGKLAVLRKDKGFDRGGIAIELYAVP